MSDQKDKMTAQDIPREHLGMTTAEAWQKHRDAPSPREACYAAGLTSLFNKRVQNRWEQEKQYLLPGYIAIAADESRKLWSELDEIFSLSLTDTALFTLGNHLKDRSKKSNQTLAEINKDLAATSTDSFTVWNSPKEAEFIKRLDSDPLIQRAKIEWINPIIDELEFDPEAHSETPYFPEALRDAVGQRVHEIHAEVYGYPTVPIEKTTWPPVKTEDGETFLSSAQYIDPDRKIEVNTYKDRQEKISYHTSALEHIALMAHESFHAFQFVSRERLMVIKDIEASILTDWGLEKDQYMPPDQYDQFIEEIKNRMDTEPRLQGGKQDPINEGLLPSGPLRTITTLYSLSYLSAHASGSSKESYEGNILEVYPKNFQMRIIRALYNEEEKQKVLKELKNFEKLEDDLRYIQNQYDRTIQNPEYCVDVVKGPDLGPAP